MDAATYSHEQPVAAPARSPIWQLNWLTPGLCRALFAVLVLAGSFGNLFYLHHNCPIDLSGDEAQYWDWSRQLELSYYSKGPLVAYIIRASCAIFGDSMQAVRYPAILLGACTLVVTYLLARKLFRSDRVALGAALLYHIVPMFVAGSVLMTIDPPFFLCWALATYLLAIAVFDEKRWPWPVIGVIVGIGFLAKYAMFLWFVPAILVLAFDRRSRRTLASPWPWVAVTIAAVFTTQVIVWNARHDWVSLKHVSTQTGTNTSGKFSLANVLEFVGGQFGVLGPGVAILMIGAVVHALRKRSTNETPALESNCSRERRFLLIIGLTFFLFTFFTSFRTKVQLNWPAPAYFTLIILTAHFIGTRMSSRATWKPWRFWVWFAAVFGIIMLPLSHDVSVLYPAMNWLNPKLLSLRESWTGKGGIRGSIAKRISPKGLTPRIVDFTAKLKGWEELGRVFSGEIKTLGPDAFVMCHDYQQAAELAFYMEGRPKTYYAASYYQRNPGRMTQYDVWPDRDLSPNSPLVGHNAIYLGNIGSPTANLLNAFQHVDGSIRIGRRFFGWVLPVPSVESLVYEEKENGVTVRTFRYFKCYGFKGMKRPASNQHH